MMIKTKQSFIIVFILVFVFLNSNIACANYELKDAKEILLGDIFLKDISAPTIKLEARIDVPLELDLEKALKIALLQNLDLIDAQYQSNIQKWKLWENYGNWLPDYSLGLAGQRFDGSFLVGGVFPVTALTSSVNAFMRFDYHFFEGGKGFFNTLAAKKLYKASREHLSGSINDILLSVYRIYNQLLREQAQLDVLAKAVEEAKANLELNINLEKEGVGTRFDVLQAEAKLAEQEEGFLSQQELFREASINLARLLNLDQGTHIKPSIDDLKIRQLFDIVSPIKEIIELAKNTRPEIRKAFLEYRAQRNLIGVAFSDFLPKANFFGQWGGTGKVFFHRTTIQTVTPDAIALDSDGNPVNQHVNRNRILNQTFNPQVNLSDITDVSNVIRGAGKPFTAAVDDSLMSSKFIGVQVEWLLGKGLGVPTISKINQVKNDALIKKNNIEKLDQQIENEVRVAYLNAQVAEKILEVSEKRVKASSEALRLARLRLENGIGINTELLNAQTDYKNALSSKVNAVVGYNNAQAELLHSVGLITVEKLVSN